MLAETFIELIKDPNHWLFEGVTDVVYTAFGAVGMRVWIKAHDKKHHDKECKHNGID